MADVFSENNAVRGVRDRVQRIAFWVALIGFTANVIVFGLYATNDDVTILLFANFMFYNFVISAIAWSSYRDHHFNTVLLAGIVGIYTHMWGTTFYDASVGNGSILSFPTLLFAPLCLVLVSGPRVLLGVAAIQGIAVFCYAEFFLASVYNLNTPAVESTNLAVLLGVMSALSLFVLAIVSFAQSRTDRRLLGLIRETERLAAEDPLTGLKNRRAFMDGIERQWSEQAPFVIAFIDLDRFKPLNDEYGHAVGDRVLKVIGQRLLACDQLSIAARFGGDEFAIMVAPGSDACAAEDIIRQVHKLITAEIDVEIGKVTVGASIGFAIAYKDAASISELLHSADTAMMRCKANGLQVTRFDPGLDTASLTSTALEGLFRKALSNGQIKAALQPIVRQGDARVVGHELLTRWQGSGLARDPQPGEFIAIAEKLGLLDELLRVTLDQAIPAVIERSGFLAINVSPSQLSSSTFTDIVTESLDRFGFAANRLEIEVTENVAFRNIEDNIRVLNTLRNLGCRIVLDDFGAGYSSLSLLDKLPLDKIKLDKSLQSTAVENGVLGATIRLVRDLGFQCCVEGIETEEAAAFASAQNCDQMQGYWFGHPKLVKVQPPLRLVADERPIPLKAVFA